MVSSCVVTVGCEVIRKAGVPSWPADLEAGENPDEDYVEVGLVDVGDFKKWEEDEVEPSPEGQVEPLVKIQPVHELAVCTVWVQKHEPLAD